MKIRQINIDHDDVTFYFDNDPEPFTVREFTPNSVTRKYLETIENLLLSYPHFVKKKDNERG